jgi:nicotinamide-nucleotide amidase
MDAAPRVAIAVTGDEILRGRVADRNGGFLAGWCTSAGLAVAAIVIVGDRADAIAATVTDLLSGDVDLVITTGGLGVTHDDVTMAAVAGATGRRLELSQEALERVKAAASGVAAQRVPDAVRDQTERKQATLPVGARMLAPVGTAPGCVIDHGAQTVVVLPGPPYEASRMWEAATSDPAVAALIARAGGPPAQILRMHGVAETQVVAALDAIPADVRATSRLGICAKAGELELTIADRTPGGANALADALDDAFPGATFTRTGQVVEQIIAEYLIRRRQTAVVAESCTGGLLGARLTAQPGSSTWFAGGVITYANEVKHALLGVSERVLAQDGAVSARCAAEMAEGVCARLGADWGVSITGIAGPGGGTPDKPVGTVFIGCTGPDGTVVGAHHFRGDRSLIRERATVAALHLLRRCLDDAVS